ncbi:ABC transporter integral membrane type 1 [Fusarium beomiforme]|uniref:ABC transporter integral membrane type 1 n=1 Tax=Fusarium beomiforme TaxID=44412 RepID=A0A9P5AVU2_9HYPO|nr:ABC transporter integral membrane type 1 [Fusarium beomiforme]
MKGASAIPILYSISVLLQVLVLLVENVEKSRLLLDPCQYSPEELASPLARLLFSWLIPLLRLGYDTILSMATLTPLSEDLKSRKLEPKLFRMLKDAESLSLLRELFKLRRGLLLPILPRMFLLGFTLAQPFLIHTAVSYTSLSHEERSVDQGNLLVAAFVLTFLGYASTVPGSMDTGCLTLMTVDVEKVMLGFEDFHELWASIAQIAIAIYVLASYMSWACVAPVIVPIVCVAMTVPVTQRIGTAQGSWNAAVEKRVNLTSAVLSNLKEVRILGISRYTASLLQHLRAEEIIPSTHFRRLMAAIIVLSQGTIVLGPFVTFALYTIILRINDDSSFTASKAFTSLSLINLIAAPISVLIQSLPSFAAGLSSLSRIESFVSSTTSPGRSKLQDEKASPAPECLYLRGSETGSSVKGQELNERGQPTLSYHNTEKPVENSIRVKQARFGWKPDNDVVYTGDFEVREGALAVVMGPVGCGKSTFLHGLLNAVPHIDGQIWLKHRNVSLCEQTPWLISGSIRGNITCGTAFDQFWYNKVLAACALVQDIDHLSGGDMHEVGNEGSSLSGGQRQRIALARAVYARNPILFLDDPFSGVDHATSKHITKALFGNEGLLRRGNITVLITTNSRKLDNLALHSIDSDQKDDVISLADNALIIDQGGNVTATTEPNIVEDTIMVTSATKGDVEVSNDMQRQGQAENNTSSGPSLELIEAKADLQRRSGDWKIYSFYAHSTGRFNATAFVCLCLSCAFCYQFSTIWIQWWSDASDHGNRKSNGFYLGIYALLCALGLSTLYLACWTSMVAMVTRSAIKLHLMVLTTVFNAHVSYFSTIDDGITLNRFNQDMQLADYTLPLAIVNTFLFASICLVQAAVISATANYMAAAIPFCLTVIYFIQRFYLRTSRQLRLLDIEAKAPLYTNFKETILGMNTIRAYGGDFGSFLKEKHTQVLDASQQPIYLLYTVQRWLSLVLDLVVACLATLLIVVAVQTRSKTSGSDMGVALVNLTSFNQYLTMLIRCWASMETSLGAIARIKDFSRETPVADGCGNELQSGSESSQSIVFKDVTVAYAQSKTLLEGEEDNSEDTSSLSPGHLALDSINFIIRPGTKVAITGRSGSGKSTLISSLFRIVPLTSGTISIGGLDISQADQQVIQDRLNAITQSSFFLPGISLKENLDPSGSHDEEGEGSLLLMADVIKDVLESMQLWPQVEERGGLEGLFSQSSWSVGQLQLLSVARAIVKKRRIQSHPDSGWKILVLDEVTSSLDEISARMVRDRIKFEFADYTILSIVHKFDGVIEDMDEMLIMDQGKVIRRGPPRELLQAM